MRWSGHVERRNAGFIKCRTLKMKLPGKRKRDNQESRNWDGMDTCGRKMLSIICCRMLKIELPVKRKRRKSRSRNWDGLDTCGREMLSNISVAGC